MLSGWLVVLERLKKEVVVDIVAVAVMDVTDNAVVVAEAVTVVDSVTVAGINVVVAPAVNTGVVSVVVIITEEDVTAEAVTVALIFLSVVIRSLDFSD